LNFELIRPELCLVGFAVLVILLDLFTEKKGWLAVVSLVGLVVSAGLAFSLWGSSPRIIFNGMLAVDNFAIFFKILFLGVALLVILASTAYVSKFAKFQGEYYALILMATLGMLLMASATDLISLFVSLELVNLSLYALVGFLKEARSAEAALKYLLLSAIASAVLLFGMAMVFGFTGKTQLGEIAAAIRSTDIAANPALLLGVILILAGFGFKIGMVPFHMWVPDAYQGAPTPITAYLSVGSKAAGFAILLRVFYSAFILPANLSSDWGVIVAILAAVSMTVGNIIAIQQNDIKRMLGYSSIAQVGYVLVGLAAVGLAQSPSGSWQSSILFFLASYALTNLVAFIAIIAITLKINSDHIDDFAGMGQRTPLIAGALTLAMVSLIGLPPAAGFMAKFYIFSVAVQHGLLWLVAIAVINSVISAFYYLRVVKVMWMNSPASREKVDTPLGTRVALVLSSLGVLLFGLAPSIGMHFSELAQIFSFLKG
jgi:NADH-quinone oxidoreductase subunit N